MSRNRPKGYRPRGHGCIDPIPKPQVVSQRIFQILISGFVAYNPSFQLSVSYEGKKNVNYGSPAEELLRNVVPVRKILGDQEALSLPARGVV